MTLVFGRDCGCEPHRCAHARNSDPVTSHEAAASVPAYRIRNQQILIHFELFQRGPGTDEALYERLKRGLGEAVMSPSGARTRRAELVAMGKVRDSGRTERLASGRKAIVWAAVEDEK